MAIVEFIILIENIDQIYALFDRIQVWRSPDDDGDPTPYVQITAPDATSAVIDGTVAGPWNINGQSLTITLDGGEPVTVNFSGTDPIGFDAVRDKINEAFPTFAPTLATEIPTDTDKIRLSSTVVGTQSSLLLSGTAAATLGLSTTKVNGKAASPILSKFTEDYPFRDYDGDTAYFYKTKYHNTKTGAISDFSSPVSGGLSTCLPGSSTVIGKIAIADATGTPVIDRRIILVPNFGQIVNDGGSNNYGVFPSMDRIEIFTDANGRAEISLVKGQRMKVFIEGTTFQREFVVPNTDFDILTVASTQPDPFSIVVAPPMPIRL